MGHTSITCALLFGLATTAIAQLQPASVASPGSHVAPAHTAAAEGLQDVTAAAVVETLRARFAGSDVEFKFDSFGSQQTSVRDVQVQGAGHFRLEGGTAWMPIRYSALYDTTQSSIESPEIRFAAVTSRQPRSIDGVGLDRAVGSRIAAEFASQSVQFDLGTLRLIGGDARYAMVEGAGVARFGGEGDAPVSVQAVFDRGSGKWLGVVYELEGEPA